MDDKILEEIGLTKSEKMVYLALLKLGTSKAGKLSEETDFNRTTVYKAIEKLTKKGLVGFVIKENTKYFEATNPNNLLKTIEKEEEKIKETKDKILTMIPELEVLFESNEKELEARIFKSSKGIKAIFDDILKNLNKGDEYIAFGVPKTAENLWGFFEEFNEKLSNKEVNSKIIFDEKANKNIKSCKKFGYDVRKLPTEFMSPAEINIYKDNVVIILWSKTPLAIAIKGEEIAKSFKQYFRVLWNIAQKT